jgi:hypothetical protein
MFREYRQSDNRLSLAIKNEHVFLVNFFLLIHLLRFELPSTYETYYYYGILFKPIRAFLRLVYSVRRNSSKTNVLLGTFDDVLITNRSLRSFPSGKIRIALLITHKSLIEHQLALLSQLKTLETDIFVIDATDRTDNRNAVNLNAAFDDLEVVPFHKNIFDDFAGLVVLQYPYLRFVRELINFERVQTVVLGYGPNICSSDVYRGKLNTEYCFPLYFKVNLVGVLNSQEKSKFLRSGHPSQKILVTGDPLAWNIVHSAKTISSDDIFAPFVFDVLWAPHHSKTSHFEDKPGYSNFERDVFYILEIASSISMRLLIRPHFLLLEAIKTAQYSDQIVSAWNELISLDNVSISSDFLMVEDLRKSQVLITEGISIIPYAILMGLDVVLSVNDLSPGFNEIFDSSLVFRGKFSSLPELKELLNPFNVHEIKVDRSPLQRLLIDGDTSPGEKLMRHFLKGAN